MNKEIAIKFDKNYGRRVGYVVSSHKDALETLTGKRTLTRGSAIALAQLGFTFAVSVGSSGMRLPLKMEDVLNELV